MPRWQKGQSGNPNGRPPKSRTLSHILAQKAEDLIQSNDGDTQSNKEAVADLLWQFATTGKVELPTKTLYAESVTDWLNAVRWIYTHIDGPAPLQTGDDKLEIQIVRTPRLTGTEDE